MTVSGKRAGVEFQQTIQTPLINVKEAGLPALVVAPLYQIINAIEAEAANPNAIAKNARGDTLLYDGEKLIGADDPTPSNNLIINFWRSPTTRTGAVALPTLINNSLILPNERVLGAVTSDSFFKVFLNPPGTDEFVELRGPGVGPNYDFDIVTLVSPANVAGETVGIELKPGILDSTGNAFSTSKRAQVVIGVRVLRRDYSRKVLKLKATDLATIMGGTYGAENPAAFSLQNVFEAAPENYAYMIAVDEVTDAYLDGTYESYVRALGLAATSEVYTVFIPTYDRNILNALKNHVLSMSTPEGRKERIGLAGTLLPTLSASVIKASGVGDLKPVAPFFEASATGIHYYGEAVQAGDSLNNKLHLVIASVLTPSAVTRVDRTEIGTSTVATTVGSSIVVDAGVPAGAVGDFLRYVLADVAATTDAETQTLTDTRNFREVGVRVNDKILVDDGLGLRRFAVQNILSNTSLYDTLELVPVGHTTPLQDSVSVSHQLYITTAIQAISGSNVTIAAVMDTLNAALAVAYLEPDDYTISVDRQSGVAFDSSDLVALLNADLDVPSLATFYVGSNAVNGVEVAVGTFNFAGGSDLYNQFFTNTDIGSLVLPVVPGSPVGAEKDIYLDMASENRDALVLSLRKYNGSVVVQDPSADLARPDLTGLKVGESFSLYSLGDSLTITTPLGDEPDLQRQAETLALFPSRFATRRMRAIWPDVAVRTVNGVKAEVPGIYLGATLAGMIAALPPQQGHSELPIPGWESLLHSNDYFNEEQLSLLTASGWWVYVQDSNDSPIVCRKQYTTDVSGDLTAEASFTTTADNFQKEVRASVQPLMGKNNLTPDLVDRVRLLIQSVGNKYVNRQALKSYTLNSLTPSSEPGDLTTLIGDITLEFYGPFNLLRIQVNI